METVDDFIGEGKPLADRWRAVLDREYVKKSDLRKLVERWREQRYSDSGFSAYENAMRRCADELEYELNRESNQ